VKLQKYLELLNLNEIASSYVILGKKIKINQISANCTKQDQNICGLV